MVALTLRRLRATLGPRAAWGVPLDVLVTGGEPTLRVARELSPTIPIVMAASRDPVGSGLVASLARPGGNLTGLSILGVQLTSKRLELLKETVPSISRVAILGARPILSAHGQARERG